jgi:hypothetical protein
VIVAGWLSPGSLPETATALVRPVHIFMQVCDGGNEDGRAYLIVGSCEEGEDRRRWLLRSRSSLDEDDGRGACGASPADVRWLANAQWKKRAQVLRVKQKTRSDMLSWVSSYGLAGDQKVETTPVAASRPRYRPITHLFVIILRPPAKAASRDRKG